MRNKSFFQKKSSLDKRIVALEIELDERVNKAVKDNRFCVYWFDIFKEQLEKCKRINSYEDYLFFYNIMTTYDKNCKISLEAGEMINNLMKDPNYYGAIHRTYLGKMEYQNGIPSIPELDSIMEDGLINNGHGMSSAAFSDNPSLSLTTSPLIGIAGIGNFCSKYKENNVIILLKFPKDKVDDELSFKGDSAKDIYDTKKGLCFIKPEYVMGAFIEEEDKQKYFTREQILSVKQNENQI